VVRDRPGVVRLPERRWTADDVKEHAADGQEIARAGKANSHSLGQGIQAHSHNLSLQKKKKRRAAICLLHTLPACLVFEAACLPAGFVRMELIPPTTPASVKFELRFFFKFDLCVRLFFFPYFFFILFFFSFLV
jgi:hypothetical protein